jgi:hypothetical protein
MNPCLTGHDHGENISQMDASIRISNMYSTQGAVDPLSSLIASGPKMRFPVIVAA